MFLEELDIMSNKLTQLPQGLFLLPRLKKLSFGNHKFSEHVFPDTVATKVNGNYFPELPAEITQLRTLKELNIKSISLKKLPQGFEVLRGLKWVNLAHNELHDVPLEVQALPNLNFNGIWITGNPMVKWLPLMMLQGRIRHAIWAADQGLSHLAYCTAISQTITSAPIWMGKGIDWVVNNPKEAISYVGIPLLSMFMDAQNRGRLASFPPIAAIIYDIKYN